MEAREKEVNDDTASVNSQARVEQLTKEREAMKKQRTAAAKAAKVGLPPPTTSLVRTPQC